MVHIVNGPISTGQKVDKRKMCVAHPLSSSTCTPTEVNLDGSSGSGISSGPSTYRRQTAFVPDYIKPKYFKLYHDLIRRTVLMNSFEHLVSLYQSFS